MWFFGLHQLSACRRVFSCVCDRPVHAQKRKRSPDPARMSARRVRTAFGPWARRCVPIPHDLVIPEQNMTMARCGPPWSVMRGPRIVLLSQCIRLIFSLWSVVRRTFYTYTCARMCVHTRTRVREFFSSLFNGPRTKYKKTIKLLWCNGFVTRRSTDHSRTTRTKGA